jgi:hypothetical protein
MKLTEIITNPVRDEYIDKYDHVFVDATPVAKIRNLILKISDFDGFKYLGLFDGDLLVGILKLMPYKDTPMWQVVLVQIAQVYKGQYYGTFLYDYVVLDMGITLLSDVNLSVNEMGGSIGLWQRLYMQGRYQVGVYNAQTGKITKKTPQQLAQKQTTHLLLVAVPSGKTINETITEQNFGRTDRTIVFYGPTVVNPGSGF